MRKPIWESKQPDWGAQIQMGAAVVLNGASVAEVRAAIRAAERQCEGYVVIAVDGGLKSLRRARIEPDLFVGDGDSMTRAPKSIRQIRFDCDKDFSDFAGALDEMIRRKVEWIAVAGLQGGRLDHEWANLMEAARVAPQLTGLLAPGDRGDILLTSTQFTLDLEPGQCFSLFALGGSSSVTLSGARWELNRSRLQPGSRGLSNLTSGPLSLKVHRGVAALLFPRG